jgi:dolichol kinase
MDFSQTCPSNVDTSSHGSLVTEFSLENRELLKGPLYYAITITFATSVLWRSSPIAIALVCNLCAGDGVCS